MESATSHLLPLSLQAQVHLLQFYQLYPPQAVSPLTGTLLESFQDHRREMKMRRSKLFKRANRISHLLLLPSKQLARMRRSTVNLMPAVNHCPSALALAASASAFSLLLSSRMNTFSWKYWKSSSMVFVCLCLCFCLMPAEFVKTKCWQASCQN